MKKVWKIGLAVGAVVVFWTIGTALASSMSTSTKTLGAASTPVPRCDPDGVSQVFNLSGSSVASITVSGIAATCGSKTLSLEITNGSATQSGSAPVPSGGGSVTVTLGSSIAVTSPNVLHTTMVIA